MGEVRMKNDETESVDFYDHIDRHTVRENDAEDSSVDEDCSIADVFVRNFDMSCSRENILKYRIVQEQWKKLYSTESSLRLHDDIKKQVFKEYFRDDGTVDHDDFVEDYDQSFLCRSQYLKCVHTKTTVLVITHLNIEHTHTSITNFA